jgi:hypothetical protein
MRVGFLRELLSSLLGIETQEKPRTKKVVTAEVETERRETLRKKLVESPVAAVIEPPAPQMKPPYQLAAWSVPKPGNTAEQNQDAFASEEKDGRLRLCLSDGVTDASFDSRGWAEALCRSFLSRPANAVTQSWLQDELQEVATAFLSRVEARVANVDQTKAYSWLAKPRAEKGSKATLLSVELRPSRADGTVHWTAFGVGDTNLFVVRNGEMVRAWPLESASDFTASADVASTKAVAETQWRTGGKGWARPGDRLYLMTDAMAQYALKREEARDPIWRALEAMESEAAFAAFVEQARKEGMMPDDTTLQRIVISGRG